MNKEEEYLNIIKDLLSLLIPSGFSDLVYITPQGALQQQMNELNRKDEIIKEAQKLIRKKGDGQ